MVPVLPDPPKCKCNLNAKAVVVKKEGPNQGKSFWACPLPQAEQCKFFEWKDKAQQETSNKKQKSENTDPEESTRILALNLLAEKITQLESDSKANLNILYDAIQEARADIKSLCKLITK